MYVCTRFKNERQENVIVLPIGCNVEGTALEGELASSTYASGNHPTFPLSSPPSQPGSCGCPGCT